MSESEKVLTYAMNLVHVHLGQAVDSCIIAKRYSDPAVGGRRPLQHRYAIASVIHGYAGLEGVANWMRFELFENRDSKHYCVLADESIAVKRMAKDDWRDRVRLEEKLTFLLERKKAAFDAGLRARVVDVRELRNLVAHGWIGETLYELGRTDDGFVTIKDLITEFKSKFSTLRFNPPHELTFGDAQMALCAVLEAARHVLTAYGRTAFVPMYEVDDTESMGAGELRDTVGHIMKLIDESPTRPPEPPAASATPTGQPRSG